MHKNLDLFLTFLKIGAFTFGGGYAMIPLIQREICENKKWISEQEITDIVAISESTPGPVAVNAATFVGYRTNGFVGAFIATLGVVLPSFLIISVICKAPCRAAAGGFCYIRRFRHNWAQKKNFEELYTIKKCLNGAF